MFGVVAYMSFVDLRWRITAFLIKQVGKCQPLLGGGWGVVGVSREKGVGWGSWINQRKPLTPNLDLSTDMCLGACPVSKVCQLLLLISKLKSKVLFYRPLPEVSCQTFWKSLGRMRKEKISRKPTICPETLCKVLSLLVMVLKTKVFWGLKKVPIDHPVCMICSSLITVTLESAGPSRSPLALQLLIINGNKHSDRCCICFSPHTWHNSLPVKRSNE